MDRRLALAIALLPLAGCLSFGGLDAAAPPARIPWGLDGCRFAIALFPVETDALAGLMPEGFEVVVPPDVREAFVVPDPRLDALLGVEATACAVGTGPSGRMEPAWYGAVWTFAEPPEDLRETDARWHFVKWDTLVADPVLRERLVEAGAPARDGGASFAGAVGLADGTAFLASLRFEGDAPIELWGGTGGAFPFDLDGRFVQHQAAEGGLVAWRAAFASPDATRGVGHAVVPAGSFVAGLVGSGRVPAYYVAGTMEIDPAEVEIPPRPAP